MQDKSDNTHTYDGVEITAGLRVFNYYDWEWGAVDSRQFDLLARESPEFARHVMTVMAARLRHTNDRLREALKEIGAHGGGWRSR